MKDIKIFWYGRRLWLSMEKNDYTLAVYWHFKKLHFGKFFELMSFSGVGIFTSGYALGFISLACESCKTYD